MRNFAIACLGLISAVFLFKVFGYDRGMDKVTAFLWLLGGIAAYGGVATAFSMRDMGGMVIVMGIASSLLILLVSIVVMMAGAIISGVLRIQSVDLATVDWALVIIAVVASVITACSTMSEDDYRMLRGWKIVVTALTVIGTNPVLLLLTPVPAYATAAIMAAALAAIAYWSHKEPCLFEKNYTDPDDYEDDPY